MASFDKTKTLKNLREMLFKIVNTPTDGLTDEQKNERVDQRRAIREAIMVLENNALKKVVTALGKEADTIQDRIDKVEDKLHGVIDNVNVIKTVAQAFGAISKIAAIV